MNKLFTIIIIIYFISIQLNLNVNYIEIILIVFKVCFIIPNQNSQCHSLSLMTQPLMHFEDVTDIHGYLFGGTGTHTFCTKLFLSSTENIVVL